jgi:hypothetical protein
MSEVNRNRRGGPGRWAEYRRRCRPEPGLDRLLAEGVSEGDNIVLRAGGCCCRWVIQQLLEAEQTDFLGGRGRYERRDQDDGRRGWRNGYLDSSIRTAEGASTCACRRSATPTCRSARR